MILFAHAGHWLISLSYFAPVIFLVAIIGMGMLRDHRNGVTGPTSSAVEAVGTEEMT